MSCQIKNSQVQVLNREGWRLLRQQEPGLILNKKKKCPYKAYLLSSWEGQVIVFEKQVCRH